MVFYLIFIFLIFLLIPLSFYFKSFINKLKASFKFILLHLLYLFNEKEISKLLFIILVIYI